MRNVLSIIVAAALIATFTASFALANNSNVKVNVDNVNVNNVNLNNSNCQSSLQSKEQHQMISATLPKVIPVLQQIAKVKEELGKCFAFSYRKLELSHELVALNVAAFDCTGNVGFLEAANSNAMRAEKNYKNGEDIKQRQGTADQMLTQVRRVRAFYIWKTEGDVQAKKFADANNVKAY